MNLLLRNQNPLSTVSSRKIRRRSVISLLLDEKNSVEDYSINYGQSDFENASPPATTKRDRGRPPKRQADMDPGPSTSRPEEEYVHGRERKQLEDIDVAGPSSPGLFASRWSSSLPYPQNESQPLPSFWITGTAPKSEKADKKQARSARSAARKRRKKSQEENKLEKQRSCGRTCWTSNMSKQRRDGSNCRERRIID
ncbi:unnamed protein product [Caenorhabditis nigoni]